MCSYESLPVVLVSAPDTAAASSLIAEIIDNDVTELYHKTESGLDPVWRIVNKYYTADVRVHTLTDQQELQLNPDDIEAHVIYLTEDECSADSGAVTESVEARARRAGPAHRRAAVRLVAADCALAAAPLAACAARRRLDLVPLREAPDPADPAAPFSDQCGVDRVRGALHAHAWRGLVRTHLATRQTAARDRTSSSSSDSSAEGGARRPGAGAGAGSGSDSAGEEEEGAVERAEAFAAALGALEAARDMRSADAGQAVDAEGAGAGAESARLLRAEQVVAAFCRALGYDLDAC